MQVTAANDISSDTASVLTIVQPRISVVCNIVNSDPTYPGMKSFNLAPSDGTVLYNIHSIWQFSTGNTFHVYIDELSVNRTTSVSHYYDVGVHQFVLNVSNMVDYMIINETVHVEEPIVMLTVSCNKFITQPQLQLILHLETQNGSNIVYYIDYGDSRVDQRIINNNGRGPTSTYIPITYTEVGIYNISVTAANTVSNITENLSSSIFVQNPIRDILLQTPSVIAVSPGELQLSLKFTGSENPPSHLSCLVILNGTFVEEKFIQKMAVSTPFVFQTHWTDNGQVGDIEVELNCSNKLSNSVVRAWTLLQMTVIGLQITVDKNNIPVGGSINFVFTIVAGSHASYKYTFGDGYEFSSVIGETVFNNHQIVKNHTFNQKGLYDVTFHVTNLVSFKTVTNQVGVLEEVKGLKLFHFYHVSDVNSALSNGQGPNTDIFPMERDVIFNTTVVSGNGIIYQWSFGDGKSDDTTSGSVSHRYDSPGSYTVTVNASNALYNDVKSTVIYIEQTILPNILTNNGPLKAYLDMTFTLQLHRPGTNPCYVWDMGDGSQGTVYGDKCEGYAAANNYIHKPWSPMSVLTHVHMYRTNNTCTVRVTAFNNVSTANIVNIAIISGVSCYYPVVHINGGGQQVDKPVSGFRSDWKSLESTVEVNCEASSIIEYDWKVYIVEQGQNFLDYIYTEYPVYSISTSEFNILFPPLTFVPGHYKISLNASITGIPGLFSEDFTYLNIQKTPLVIGMFGGNARAIGYDTMFVLNAKDYSYDLDVVDKTNKTGITFEFRCRKSNEDYPEQLEQISIPTVEESYNLTRIGGCFGTGIGKLSGIYGKLELNSLLLEPDSENIFEILMTKDSRTAEMQQIVKIIEGNPPNFEIR